MVSRIISYTPLGLEAIPVQVEVDAGRGLPGLSIIGLPDQTIKEAKERVRTAILNSQFLLPSQRITVNLAPAGLKKEGGVFDLPIALGILAAIKQLNAATLAPIAAVGELALDGRVRPVAGILPMALTARQRGQTLMIPAENLHEASLVKGLSLVPVSSLQEAVDILTEQQSFLACRPLDRRANEQERVIDFSDVKGQSHAKRAIEIAVAGRHHLLFIGPPGSGKTLLAQRIPTVCPALSYEESIAVTAIHSVAGLIKETGLLGSRPFRAPHHTASSIALIGGGPYPKPGELSLAHHGVLFLDELPEFHRDAIESLRQPLEEGVVRIARAKRSLTFPAECLLVAAMNPCPCGYLTVTRGRCRCSSRAIQTYLGKISGPLLDRIDLHVEVPALSFDALSSSAAGDTSEAMHARIVKAIRRQQKRSKTSPPVLNGSLQQRQLRALCSLNAEARKLLKEAMQELGLSARSYDKILKIARTIADLSGTEEILPEHIAEAINYRALDRQLWM